MFRAIDISESGLKSYKQMLEVTANNITNINTTRTQDGGPYKRQAIILEERKGFDEYLQRETGEGVNVKKVIQDKSEKTIYDPEHPDANKEGFVRVPNIQLAAEMTNMMQEQRGYGAVVTVLNATKEVIQKENEIGRA